MKKFQYKITFFLVFFMFSLMVTQAPAAADNSFQAKFDIGYFQGLSSDWSDVYESGGFQFDVGAKYKILDWLRLSLDLAYLMAQGEAVSSNDFPYFDPPESDFTVISTTIGADYIHPLSTMCLYGGLGIGYLMWTEEWSGDDFDNGSYDGSSIGYEVHFGLDYTLTEAIFLNAEARYQSASFEISEDAEAEYLGDTREFTGLILYVGAGYQF